MTLNVHLGKLSKKDHEASLTRRAPKTWRGLLHAKLKNWSEKRAKLKDNPGKDATADLDSRFSTTVPC